MDAEEERLIKELGVIERRKSGKKKKSSKKIQPVAKAGDNTVKCELLRYRNVSVKIASLVRLNSHLKVLVGPGLRDIF